MIRFDFIQDTFNSSGEELPVDIEENDEDIIDELI